MEDGGRIEIITWLIIIPLLGYSQSSKLTQLETDSDYSSYGYYNEGCNRLLYFGVLVDKDQKITGSCISVKDISNGKELAIEKNIGYPAIGWVNDSTVLVFKFLIDPDKSIFSVNHGRVLYTFNVFTNEIKQITDIPLKDSGSNLAVDANIIVYQTRFRASTRFFKYDLRSKETTEFLPLSGLPIGDGHFAYDGTNDFLAFVIFENEKYRLKLLSKGSLKTIVVSDAFIDKLSFHKKDNRLYYTVQLGKDGGQVLESVDLDNLKIERHFKFEPQEESILIAPYKERSLIVSLSLPVNHPSKHELDTGNLTATVEINPNRNLFVMTLNDGK